MSTGARRSRRKNLSPLLAGVLLAWLASACSPAPTPTATTTPGALPGDTPTVLPGQTSTPGQTLTPTPSPGVTATLTPLPDFTPTPTAIPTYVKLRGEVTIEQAVCHYGPGAPYLYKYGVYKGSHLEIIRRVELGNYIEVQAIGGNNPCWVRADYMDIAGDLLSVQPVSAEDVSLPPSPYYGPLTGVSARRDGHVVTVSWNPLTLKAGDDSEQTPYIVEAWVCQGGRLLFTPVGSYQAAVQITDEPGCDQPSHAWVTAAEKHGYTRRVEVPWP